MQRGFDLAVEEINAAGGIDVGGTTYNIETVIETTSGTTGLPDPATAANSLSKLVDEDEVFAIVGGFRTEVVVSIQSSLTSSKTPFFNIGSTAPLISPYIYRTGPSNGTQLARNLIELYAFYMRGLGVENITIAREEASWSLRLSNVLKGYLMTGGLLGPTGPNMTFSADIVIPTASSSDAVETAMAGLKTSSDNAILTLFSAPVGKFVTEAWSSQNLPQYLAGINVESQRTDFFIETEGASYGEIELETLPPDITPNTKTTDFREAYEEKYDVGPTYTAIASYDSVYVIKDALERAGEVDVEKFRTALDTTDIDLPGYKIKFTQELGPQLGVNSTGHAVPITGFDPAVNNFTVHDLFTPATVAVRSNGYIQGYFAQWQKDGVKKTVYMDKPFTPTPDTSALIKAPINHTDFGTVPTTGAAPISGFELPIVLLIVGSLAAFVNLQRRKK
jgi:branched-chain amino acid transport system substrate-binding protein